MLITLFCLILTMAKLIILSVNSEQYKFERPIQQQSK